MYETSNFVNNLAKLLNINVNWNKEQTRELELKKCYMRGVIRESRFMGLLQKHLITELKKINVNLIKSACDSLQAVISDNH